MCLRNRGWIRCLERLIFPQIQRKGHEPGESPLSKVQFKNDHLYSLCVFMALPGTTLPVPVQVLTYLTTLLVPFTVP